MTTAVFLAFLGVAIKTSAVILAQGAEAGAEGFEPWDRWSKNRKPQRGASGVENGTSAPTGLVLWMRLIPGLADRLRRPQRPGLKTSAPVGGLTTQPITGADPGLHTSAPFGGLTALTPEGESRCLRRGHKRRETSATMDILSFLLFLAPGSWLPATVSSSWSHTVSTVPGFSIKLSCVGYAIVRVRVSFFWHWRAEGRILHSRRDGIKNN